MSSDNKARCQTAWDDLPTPVVERKRSDGATIAAAATSAGNREAAASRSGTAIDLDAMLDEIPGGFEMAVDLASLFLDECPSVLRQIREGMHGDNPRLVRRGAHTLKSSAGIFCAQKMVEAAGRLERLACDGECAALREPYYALEREADRVLGDLKRLCAGG